MRNLLIVALLIHCLMAAKLTLASTINSEITTLQSYISRSAEKRESSCSEPGIILTNTCASPVYITFSNLGAPYERKAVTPVSAFTATNNTFTGCEGRG